jgi:hypothetical protein
VRTQGYLSAELVAHGPGGHSSMPTAENPIGILAQAVAKLYGNPMPASISGAVKVSCVRVRQCVCRACVRRTCAVVSTRRVLFLG